MTFRSAPRAPAVTREPRSLSRRARAVGSSSIKAALCGWHRSHSACRALDSPCSTCTLRALESGSGCRQRARQAPVWGSLLGKGCRVWEKVCNREDLKIFSIRLLLFSLLRCVLKLRKQAEPLSLCTNPSGTLPSLQHALSRRHFGLAEEAFINQQSQQRLMCQ